MYVLDICIHVHVVDMYMYIIKGSAGNNSCMIRKPVVVFFHMKKTKLQTRCLADPQQISAFLFSTFKVQSLFFINLKFKLSYVADQLCLSQTWRETFIEMRLTYRWVISFNKSTTYKLLNDLGFASTRISSDNDLDHCGHNGEY